MSQKKINSICLGTANFGSKYGINNKRAVKNDDLKKILNYATQNNINFIDTAINYKNSEKKIGLARKYKLNIVTKLPKIPRKITSIDKWIVNKILGSCKRLKIRNLYGVLIHDTAELKNYQKSKKIYKAFDYLLKEKIVKKIGLSIYDPDELDLYFEKYDYQIIQAPINIFDRRLISSGWGKKLIKKKVEIFARSIFLKGLLLKDLDKIPKDFIKWKKNFRNFEQWTKEKKISKVEACIRYVKSLKEINKIILGVSSINQLKENINLFKKKKRLLAPKYLNISSGKIINPREWKT